MELRRLLTLPPFLPLREALIASSQELRWVDTQTRKGEQSSNTFVFLEDTLSRFFLVSFLIVRHLDTKYVHAFLAFRWKQVLGSCGDVPGGGVYIEDCRLLAIKHIYVYGYQCHCKLLRPTGSSSL